MSVLADMHDSEQRCMSVSAHLHGGQHEQGPKAKQQQAPQVPQVRGQAQVGDSIQY